VREPDLPWLPFFCERLLAASFLRILSVQDQGRAARKGEVEFGILAERVMNHALVKPTVPAKALHIRIENHSVAP
jgi:hypothetical protein